MKKRFVVPPTFSQFPELETEHLLLTEIKLEHIEDIFDHFSNREVTRYLDLTPIQTRQDAHQLITFLTDRFKKERGIRWGIMLKGDNRLIGTCGYNSWAKGKGQAELGYDLVPAYWRRGIATEAVGTVIQFGFEKMGLRKIEAFISPDNIASQRFIERLGFQYATTVREFQFSSSQFARMTVFHLERERWVVFPRLPYRSG